MGVGEMLTRRIERKQSEWLTTREEWKMNDGLEDDAIRATEKKKERQK